MFLRAGISLPAVRCYPWNESYGSGRSTDQLYRKTFSPFLVSFTSQRRHDCSHTLDCRLNGSSSICLAGIIRTIVRHHVPEHLVMILVLLTQERRLSIMFDLFVPVFRRTAPTGALATVDKRFVGCGCRCAQRPRRFW